MATTTGPAWMASGDTPGIGTRRRAYLQPDYTGTATSPEQYLFESIAPDVHLVEGYQPIMPKTFSNP